MATRNQRVGRGELDLKRKKEKQNKLGSLVDM